VLQNNVSIDFSKEKGRYEIHISDQRKLLYQDTAGLAANTDGFYWRCLVDLRSNKKSDVAKEIVAIWMRKKQETPQYCAAWLYQGKYDSKNTKFEPYCKQCPSLPPSDPILKYEYALRCGIIACRQNKFKKAKTSLEKILNYKKEGHLSDLDLKSGQNFALFYLVQVVHGLKEYHECAPYLVKIDKSIDQMQQAWKPLLDLVKTDCIKDWYRRVLEVATYGRECLTSQEFKSEQLLEEWMFWDRNTQSPLPTAGLGIFYFSQGCCGNTELERKTGLSLPNGGYNRFVLKPLQINQSQRKSPGCITYVH